jgi:nucleoside-diphosphate-sugar epimerase
MGRRLCPPTFVFHLFDSAASVLVNSFDESTSVNGLIVGCGYLGQQVARRWIDQGLCVYALTRSEDSAQRLAQQSIHPIQVDWYDKDRWPKLPSVDRLLVCASHAPVTGLPSSETHVRGLRNLFAQLDSIPRRLAYLSTTGVYAACDDGRWIDECGPVNPNRPGSVAALAAEQWIIENLPIDRYSILRAAGIYGPGRIPRLDKLRSHEPIDVDPESYLNLIHVEDLAEAVIALLNQLSANGIFNVSDGNPPLRRDYYQYIATTIGSAMPEFRDAGSNNQASEGATIRRRGEGNKRVSNQRLVESLDFHFHFPDFKAGLTPLLKSG